MAAYSLEITLSGGTTGKKKQATAENEQSAKEQKAAEKARKKAVATGVAAVGIAKKYATIVVSNQVNTVALRTGQNEEQARQQFTLDIASQAANIGISLAAGAMMGPVGLGMAAIGVVTSLVDTGIQIAQKQRVIDLNRAVENVVVGMANIRAGTDGNRQR